MARSANSNVRGPQSALTDFLASQGISSASVAARVRARNRVADNDTPDDPSPSAPVAGSSSAQQEQDEEEYASDNLDDPEEDAPLNKKRKKNASKLSRAHPSLVKKWHSKKKRAQEDEDSEEDPYTALPGGRQDREAFDPENRPGVGSLEVCIKCDKQFTFTRYTLLSHEKNGWLCHQCAKSSGLDPLKKPAPRKRKAPQEKRQVVNFEEIDRVPPLSTICINLISRHLDDIEAFGDIGVVNTNEILRVIAKRRCLNAENAKLFYSVENRDLTLYDATNLKPPALCTIGSLNPNLRSLRLDFCGLINNEVLNTWSNQMSNLTRIELLGPFLVRREAWIEFFKSRGQGNGLEAFLIMQSPRFDIDCIEALTVHHPNLKELRLSEIGKMEDSFLPHIGTLKELTSLDLSSPATSLNDEALIELLSQVGTKLTLLDLSSNDALTDALFVEGIQKHCNSLTTLRLANIPDLTDAGIEKFFADWANIPVPKIDLSRSHNLSSGALQALLKHSGGGLTELTINSWKDTSNDALLEIGSQARNLEMLDISWCRQVDDFVVKKILDNCEKLTRIKCYGCNRLTVNCPRKTHVQMLGIEAHTASRVI